MEQLWLPLLAQAPRDRHVIVISIDGFPAYALRDPALPVPTLCRLLVKAPRPAP
jgi:hypothetical protein